MSDRKISGIRFNFGELLLMMAALAGALAFVSRAAPAIQRMVHAGDMARLTGVVIMAALGLVPLAFFLAVRLAFFGLSVRTLRRPDRTRDVGGSTDDTGD